MRRESRHARDFRPAMLTGPERYWRKNLVVIGVLLAVGFAVTFGVAFHARALSFVFLGWPFSFWMGAQGALLVYCLIVGFYAWYMNRLDLEHGAADEDD